MAVIKFKFLFNRTAAYPTVFTLYNIYLKLMHFGSSFACILGSIFGVYRAEFECKKGSLIRRLYMQNALVFNIYCTYISRILGINLVYIIEAVERLDIWLDLTNLYILTGLLTLKKG